MVDMNRFDADIAEERERNLRLGQLRGLDEVTIEELEAFMDGRNPYPFPANRSRQWKCFYEEVFCCKWGKSNHFDDTTMNVAKLWINYPLEEEDYQAVFMQQGTSYADAFAAYELLGVPLIWSRFLTSEDTESLCDARSTKNTSYTIVTEGESANSTKSLAGFSDGSVDGMTLLEVLIYGLFYYWVSGGKHIYVATLCTGSVMQGGLIPNVGYEHASGGVVVRVLSPNNIKYVDLHTRGVLMSSYLC